MKIPTVIWIYSIIAVIPASTEDAFISLGSIDGYNLTECNTNVTLQCSSNAQSFHMIIKGNNTTYVTCLNGNKCKTNGEVMGNYTAEIYDGFVVLNIGYIGHKEKDTLFSCATARAFLYIQPTVRVYPRKPPTEMNTVYIGSVVELKVTTGCVLLKNNLTFIWGKTTDSNGTNVEPLTKEDAQFKESIIETNNTLCLPSKNCGGTGVSKSLTFKPGNAGESYYMHCTIVTGEIYSNVTLISDKPFKFIVTVVYVNITINNIRLGEQKIALAENSIFQIECVTSYSRPKSNFSLHGLSSRNITHSNCSFVYDFDGLASTRCLYVLQASRSFDKSVLYCNATNMPGSQTTSGLLILDILYPPDGPPVIQNFAQGQVVAVIEYTQVVLTCVISKSNPITNLSWSCEGNTDVLNETTVNGTSAILKWTAKRYKNTNCTCTASYFPHLERSAVVINTLFPAKITQLYINNTRQSMPIQKIYMIENSTLTIRWDTEGNPKPNVSWLGLNIFDSNITLTNVQRDPKDILYKFLASNVMKPSASNEQRVDVNESFTLDVL